MALLSHLRTKTADCHAALEASLDVFHRVRSDGDYRELLREFYTLYEPLEERLAQAADWPAKGWDFEARRKTPWLRDDLRAVGVDETEMAGWERAGALPALNEFGAALGCLYVLEGSTLGGQVIARELLDPKGITAERGGKFFRAYGEQTGQRWREFGQWAEAQAALAPLEPAALRGARETFDGFARWMNR